LESWIGGTEGGSGSGSDSEDRILSHLGIMSLDTSLFKETEKLYVNMYRNVFYA